MNRYKGRAETTKKGFIPEILESTDVHVERMIDQATVEYGTGCWVSNEPMSENDYWTQIAVWEMFNGPVPEGHIVFNACNDYRICYNPNCFKLMREPDYES